MLTGFADSASTIEAMHLGAFDHLTKPVRRETLLAMIDAAVAASEPPPSARGASDDDEPAAMSTSREAFIGNSESMHEVQKRIGRATRSDAPVLVTGETGTGKEVVARALHRARHARGAGRSSPSTARRSPRSCSRASSSAT